MAFNKSAPVRGDLYLPDMMDDDDDELVQEVKMISLITAQEEEERRERLHRERNIVSDPKLTLQESSSLPELVGISAVEGSSGAVDGAGTQTGMCSQIARPRPQPGRTVHTAESGFAATARTGTSATRSAVPPPLPATRPNAKTRLGTDPIRIPSPPKTAQRPRAENPPRRAEVPPRARDTSSNRSQSLSPPFHRSNLVSCSISDDIPGVVAGSSRIDTPLICLSPPSLKPERVADFDLRSLDPLQPLSCGAPPPTLPNPTAAIPVPDPIRQTQHHPTADLRALPPQNSPVPSYPLDGSHFPFVGGTDTGGYPIVLGFMPWVSSDLGSPLNPGFPAPWMTESTASTSSAVAEPAGRNVSPASGVSDLMDFSADDGSGGSLCLDPDYMDLADFDPLYTVASKSWNFEQRFDSDELFRQHGSPAATILAARPVTTTGPDSKAPLPDVVAQSSLTRLTSTDELQDPFSVQDLMVSLEKKRQRHAQEQEVQGSTARGPRSQPTNKAASENAASSKREVLCCYWSVVLCYCFIHICVTWVHSRTESPLTPIESETVCAYTVTIYKKLHVVRKGITFCIVLRMY